MPHFALRPSGLASVVLLAMALGACGRSDPTPSAQAAVPPATQASASPAAVPAAAPQASSGATDSTSASADRGRIRGSESAKVWLIEISDFQCPYCKSWHDETYRILDREYVQTGKVRIAYINFPLSIHPNARPAAEAAMCGAAQGRFWELHDSLFATQDAWSAGKDPMPKFDSLAVAAHVDAGAWRRCMTTHATAPLIDADRDRAGRSGVRSTPSFFVGNRGLVGAYPIDAFRTVLDSALAAAGSIR